MKYLLFSCLFLFIISCSSDPCLDTECGIGTCIEGTCECPIGYAGESCSIDFIGRYRPVQFTSGNCTNPNYSNLSVSDVVNEKYICFAPDDDNRKECLRLFLVIREDGTFVISQQIGIIEDAEVTIDGSIEPTQNGNYTTEKNNFNVIRDDGTTATMLLINSNQIEVNYDIDDLSIGCELKVIFQKQS